MKPNRSFLLLLQLIPLGASLSACASTAYRNVDGDVVFCYLSASYVHSSMPNWRCYSDVVSFNGDVEFGVHGLRHTFLPDYSEDKNHEGRLFSFYSSSYILGGAFGMGYINTQGVDEIAIKTPILSREAGKVFNLSINSNYSKINQETRWDDLALSTEAFVSLVFKDFNSEVEGGHGYSSFPTLKETFFDKLYDYTDQKAKSIVWDKNGTIVNFFDQWALMKENYYAHHKKTVAKDIFAYVAGALMLIFLVVTIGVVYYAKRKKN
ncbi:hypothetical protein MR511_06905 [bacterium]|nr:hypothetical protein [bacterium]